MAKFSQTNPAQSAIAASTAKGRISRTDLERLIALYSDSYPDEMDALMSAIRDGDIKA